MHRVKSVHRISQVVIVPPWYVKHVGISAQVVPEFSQHLVKVTHSLVQMRLGDCLALLL